MARKFFSKNFRGKFGPIEPGIMLEALLSMNCLGEAELLIPKCRHAARHLVVPEVGVGFLCTIGDYYKLVGRCDEAIKYYMEANTMLPGFRSAILGMAGTHADRALESVRKGIKQITKLQKQRTLDSQKAACHYGAHDRDATMSVLKRLERILVKAVPQPIARNIKY